MRIQSSPTLTQAVIIKNGLDIIKQRKIVSHRKTCFCKGDQSRAYACSPIINAIYFMLTADQNMCKSHTSVSVHDYCKAIQSDIDSGSSSGTSFGGLGIIPILNRETYYRSAPLRRNTISYFILKGYFLNSFKKAVLKSYVDWCNSSGVQ